MGTTKSDNQNAPFLVPVRGTIPMNIPGHVGRCFFSKLWRKISKYCKIVGVGWTRPFVLLQDGVTDGTIHFRGKLLK